MADLGTVSVGVVGDLRSLQKQVSDAFSTGRLSRLGSAGGQAFGRGLQGGAQQALNSVRSGASSASQALADIQSNSGQAQSALASVSSEATNTAGSLGSIGSEASSATDGMSGISSTATDAAGGLGTVSDQSDSTAQSLAGVEQKTSDSTNALATVQSQADQTGQSMAKLKGQTDQATTAAARSGQTNQRVGRTFDQLHRHIGGLARGLVAVVAGYRAYSIAKNAVGVTSELARSTLNLSRVTGLDVQTSSRWVAIMKARGASTQQLGSAFSSLSKNVRAALGGNAKALEGFAALGITTADLREGLTDSEGLLGKVADGLGGLSGGFDKAALAQQVFGRGGRDMLAVLGSGNKALQEQLALADKYGVTFGGKSVKSIRDLLQAEKELKFAQLGLQVQFTQALAPALTKGLGAVNEFSQQVGKIFRDPHLSQDEKISKVGDVISQRIESATPEIANAAGRIAPKVALGFVRGFIHAGTWGQLATGAFLVSRLVGWGNIFKAAGKRAATGFAATFLPGMAAEGAAGGAAAGGAASVTSKWRGFGKVAGRAFALGFLTLGAIDIYNRLKDKIPFQTGSGGNDPIGGKGSPVPVRDIHGRVIRPPRERKAKGGIVDLKGRAFGGQIPGYSRRDDRLIAVRGGEEVLRPEDHAPMVNRAMAVAHDAGAVPFRSTREMFKRTGAFASGGTVRGFAKGGVVGPTIRRVKDIFETEHFDRDYKDSRRTDERSLREVTRDLVSRVSRSVFTADWSHSLGEAQGAGQHRPASPVPPDNERRARDPETRQVAKPPPLQVSPRVPLTQRIIQRLVPAEIPQPQALIQQVVQAAGTDMGGESPRPFVSRAAGSLSGPQVSAVEQVGIPGFAKGGWVGRDWREEWGPFDPMLGPGNPQVPGFAAGGRITSAQDVVRASRKPAPPGYGYDAHGKLRKIHSDLTQPVRDRQGQTRRIHSVEQQPKETGGQVFLSTAYGPPWNRMQGTGTTATGIDLRPARKAYIVAVDPSVIPLHSRLTAHPNPHHYTGQFAAEDTGGAIDGRHIDFYDWRGRAQQNAWGSKNVTVSVKGKGRGGAAVPAPSGGTGGKPKNEAYGYVYPLAHRGKLIGFPYQGTHNLGNWQSDNAVDIAVPFGTVVQAVADGSIVKTGGSGSFGGRFGGYNMTLKSRNNEFFYAHLSKLNTHAGRQVSAAQSIGLSGKANGVDHLHFGQERGSPLGTAKGQTEPTQGKTRIRGVTVKGEVTFGTLLDALRAKLEARLATASLTEKPTDDIRALKKLIAYWKGILPIARKNANYPQITEAATSLKGYRDDLRDVRQKVRDKQKEDKPEEQSLELDGLSVIGTGLNAYNISGLQRALDEIDLRAARASLTVPREDDDSQAGLKASLQDDIAVGTDRESFWASIYKLASGYRMPRMTNEPFDPTPAQTKALNRTKSQEERITLLNKFREESGNWIEGTTRQKAEAARNLADASSDLRGFREQANQKEDTSARDSEIADLLRQQLQQSQRELGISKAQTPIFERFKNAPRFHDGGVFRAPAGQKEGPAWLRDGEPVLTPEQAAAFGGAQELHFTVVVEDGAVDPNKIRVEAGNAVAEMVRKAKSGPAPGHKMSFPKA